MSSPAAGRALIDIDATLEKHKDIMPQLLATHTLTGLYTVAFYFGVGKHTGLRVLRSGKVQIGAAWKCDFRLCILCRYPRPGYQIHLSMLWTLEMYVPNKGLAKNMDAEG
ncbi:unnamed protein product [Owenia fusiformis]|uniref:Uncharacterized protein n=1 Tax=Owenia fusiformis TaxID=6347 RepID=A0A8J1YBB9_OWEFU|nr:unnamed protein product [Owenia fusiformis]